MKYYQANPKTGEYIGDFTARQDPVEKKKNKKTVYLLPAHASFDEPPAAEKGKAVVLEDGKWCLKDDHRGEVVYNTETHAQEKINYIGPIRDGYTTLEPGEFDSWDGEKWMTDTTKQETAEAEALINDRVMQKLRDEAVAELQAEGKLTANGKVKK